jgi:hypothetical protein
LLIIAGLAAGLAISSTQKDNGDDTSPQQQQVDNTSPMPNPSPVNPLQPTLAPTPRALEAFFASISPDGGAALVGNATSPQRLALEALENDPNLNTYSDERLQQIFATQVLRYGIMRESSNADIASLTFRRRQLQQQIDECSWKYVTCNDADQLVSIKIEYVPYMYTLPEELVFLTNMQEFIVVGTKFGFGTIPSVLAKLNQLKTIHLGGNVFTGAIPTELGSMERLDSLTLGYNELNGKIPSEFGLSTTLHRIDLISNELTGSIPSEIFMNREICYLFFSQNSLTGTLPTELGSYPVLKTFDAHENELTGPLPTEIGGMADLSGLYLHDNTFTGPIPETFANLLEMRDLYLNFNQLTGTIPVGLSFMTLLWGNLGLSHNELVGPIPTELGRLRGMANLELGYNQLNGKIPTQLGYLTLIGKFVSLVPRTWSPNYYKFLTSSPSTV